MDHSLTHPNPLTSGGGGGDSEGTGGRGSRAGLVEMGGCQVGGRKIEGFWLKVGESLGKVAVPKLVMTPQTILNLRNVSRAAAPHRYPILLQAHLNPEP